MAVCEHTISSDASKVAWDGCLHLPAGPCHTGGEISAVSADSTEHAACGAWNLAQMKEFIHLLELWAVIHMLYTFQTHLQTCVVRLPCDNTMVIAAITEGLSCSTKMWPVLCTLQLFVCFSHCPPFKHACLVAILSVVFCSTGG